MPLVKGWSASLPCGIPIAYPECFLHIFHIFVSITDIQNPCLVSFLIGCLLAVGLYPAEVAAAAVLALATGDGLSTIIGRRYGRHKLPYNPSKSIEGTLAGFLAAWFSASLILPPPTAFFGALTVAIVEPLDFLNDNILVPLVGGFVMSLF